ncbi:MAG: hypothetical protein R3F29_01515 [Planctomycetota bacterium]
MSFSAMVVASLFCAPQQPATLPAHPVAALAAAIDLPTREARRRAADELAQRDVPIAIWRKAAKELRPRPTPADAERVDEHTLRYRTSLWLQESARAAEILVRVPAGVDLSKPAPLLLVRHVAGGDGASALRQWAPLADRCGLVLAAPTETYEMYRKDGWAYMPDAADGVLEALRFVRRHHDIDENRVFLGGVGGGGHMTWDVGARHADLFAGLLPVNGSPRFGNAVNECNTMFLEALASVPVRALRWPPHDARVDEHVERALSLLTGLGNRAAERVDCRDEADALGERGVPIAWFERARQVPQKVVRVPEICWHPHRRDWGRAHWVEILRVDAKLVLPFPPKLLASKLRGRDARGQRDLLDEAMRDQQPWLCVEARGGGRFEVRDRHVHQLRILLTEETRRDTVEIKWRGTTLKKPAPEHVAVLLREFVERFDRTFLPVAEVVLP